MKATTKTPDATTKTPDATTAGETAPMMGRPPRAPRDLDGMDIPQILDAMQQDSARSMAHFYGAIGHMREVLRSLEHLRACWEQPV